MNTKTLVKKLKTRDVDIDPKTLTNWGREGIVSGCKIYPATRRSRGRPSKRPEEIDHRGKPGRFHAEWDDEAVEEVAAVWVVSGGRRRLSRTRIEMIKTVANHAYQHASAFYEFPAGIRVTGPEPTSQWNWRMLKMMVYPDRALNAQAQKWIATKEKAKRNKKISEPKKVLFYWQSQPADIRAVPIRARNGHELLSSLKRFLPDLSMTGPGVSGAQPPSSGEIPLLFPHDNVRMSRPSEHPGWELRPSRWKFDLERIELEDADVDELVFLLDGRDSRIKAWYAPYDLYDPAVDYEKRADDPSQSDQNGARWDAGIDLLVDESRSLFSEIGPLLSDMNREHVTRKITSSVLTLVPTEFMPLIRWLPLPRQEITPFVFFTPLQSIYLRDQLRHLLKITNAISSTPL
ncbi:MAG: hypothetical protein WCE82_04795 [Halobacteriota archaeon]